MYIRGLIPWNFAELAKAVLIDVISDGSENIHNFMQKNVYLDLCNNKSL